MKNYKLQEPVLEMVVTDAERVKQSFKSEGRWTSEIVAANSELEINDTLISVDYEMGDTVNILTVNPDQACEISEFYWEKNRLEGLPYGVEGYINGVKLNIVIIVDTTTEEEIE